MKKLSRIFTVFLVILLIALTLAMSATAFPRVDSWSLDSPLPTPTPYHLQLPAVFKNK